MPTLPPTIKSLVLDMDGVLWRESTPIGDLAAIFAAISRRGLKVCLATNNATRTPEQYLERLCSFGVKDLEAWQVVTSGQVLAHELVKRFPQAGPVYVIGEGGLYQSLADAGFTVVDEDHWDQGRTIIAVVSEMDRGVNYPKLRRATLLIRQGIPFYATNPDRTFPTPEGLVPGAGAIMAALVTASGVEPVVVGKPAPFMIELARERLKTSREETLIVGDRLETDIAGGQAAGCPVALVLSGVSTQAMASAWTPHPDFVVPDLAALLG